MLLTHPYKSPCKAEHDKRPYQCHNLWVSNTLLHLYCSQISESASVRVWWLYLLPLSDSLPTAGAYSVLPWTVSQSCLERWFNVWFASGFQRHTKIAVKKVDLTMERCAGLLWHHSGRHCLMPETWQHQLLHLNMARSTDLTLQSEIRWSSSMLEILQGFRCIQLGLHSLSVVLNWMGLDIVNQMVISLHSASLSRMSQDSCLK